MTSLPASNLVLEDEDQSSRKESGACKVSSCRSCKIDQHRSLTLSRPAQPLQDTPSGVEAHIIKVLLSYNHPQTSRGLLRHAGELYYQAQPSAPLHYALLMVASRYAVFDFSTSMRDALRDVAEQKALQSLQVAIGDPTLGAKDETLQSVLLLSLEEKIQNILSGYMGRVSVHHPGALALLKRRGATNFKTEISRFLVYATRNEAIRLALQSDDYSRLSAPIFQNHYDDGASNPAILLEDMIMKTLSLRERAQQIQHSGAPSKVQVLLLENRISYVWAWTQSWVQRIPDTWRPQQNAGLTGFRVDEGLPLLSLQDRVTEVFPSVKIAYLYNQWRCVLLAILELTILCDSWNKLYHDQEGKASKISEVSIRSQKQILEAIRSSLSFFIHKSGLFELTLKDKANASRSIELGPDPEDCESNPQGALNFMGDILEWLEAVSLWNVGQAPGLRDHESHLTFCKRLYQSSLEYYSKIT